MKVRIEIDTSTFVRFWLVVIGFAFAILALYLSKTALIIIGGALFLALALSAPVNKIRSYIPGRSRVAATALAYVAVVVFLGTFLMLVVPPIIDQTSKLAENAPSMVEGFTSQSQQIEDLVNKYNVQPQIDRALENAKNQSTEWAANIGSSVVGSVGSFFSAMAALFIGLVLSFLMLIEGPTFMKKIWNLYDDEEKMNKHKELVKKMHNVVTGYVTGQLSVSGIGGLASGAIVFILSFIFEGVDPELALPAIAISFVLSLIPMFGATIAGVIITILLVINSVPAGIAFLIFFIVYQQIENNLISPAIQSKYVELSPLTVLASVTIGLYLFGLAGGIISIPIAGVIKVLLEEFTSQRKKTRKKKKQPINKLLKKLQLEE